MTDELWNGIKDFYYEKFGIAPELVEIAPILDLLRLCASGSSNKTIAEFFDEDENYLADMFDAYLGFRGWSTDLKFSPLSLYKELEDKSKDNFVEAAVLKYGRIFGFDEMYNSCKVVEQLERLFNEKWI